jgi:ammonia channel protein AmtB
MSTFLSALTLVLLVVATAVVTLTTLFNLRYDGSRREKNIAVLILLSLLTATAIIALVSPLLNRYYDWIE